MDMKENLYFTLNNRSIYLDSEVDSESSKEIVDYLLAADAMDSEEPIYLYINSIGGELFAGLSIINTILSINSPVYGIVLGQAASMAFYILQACDKRYMTTYSILFWHHIILDNISFDNKQEMLKLSQTYTQWNNLVEDLLRHKKKISKTTWNKYFNKDNDIYFSAEQALELKLIDAIFESKIKK